MADDSSPTKPLYPLDGPAPGLTASYTGKYKPKGPEAGTSKFAMVSPYSPTAFAPGSMYSAFSPAGNNPYG